MACTWVQAQHRGRAPGDCCLVTGFPSGDIGIWVPTYPTEAGKGYKLSQMIPAHAAGEASMVTQDGNYINPGCSALRAARDRNEVLSGGADGIIRAWKVAKLAGDKRGATLEPLGAEGETSGPYRFSLLPPGQDPDSEGVPVVRSIDYFAPKGGSEGSAEYQFIAGTSQNDVWRVDGHPRQLVSGQVGDIFGVATHPAQTAEFVTVDDGGNVYVWDADERELERSASIGGQLIGVAVSEAPIRAQPSLLRTWKPKGNQGYHIATGSSRGKAREGHLLGGWPLDDRANEKGCYGRGPLSPEIESFHALLLPRSLAAHNPGLRDPAAPAHDLPQQDRH